MAIEIRPSGEGGLYAGLAKKAGQAIQAQRESEIVQQEASRRSAAAEEMKFRRDMAQFGAELEMQAQQAARAWELQKMQLASQLDFQMEERKRALDKEVANAKELEAKQRYLAYVDVIDQDNTLTDENKRKLKLMAYGQAVARIDISERVFFPEKFQQQTALDRYDNLTDGQGTPTVPTPQMNRANSAVKQARLELGASATDEQVAYQAQMIMDTEAELENAQIALGPNATEAQVMAEAKRRALLKNVGNIPTTKEKSVPTEITRKGFGGLFGGAAAVPKPEITESPFAEADRAEQAREATGFGQALKVAKAKRIVEQAQAKISNPVEVKRNVALHRQQLKVVHNDRELTKLESEIGEGLTTRNATVYEKLMTRIRLIRPQNEEQQRRLDELKKRLIWGPAQRRIQ